MKPVGEWRFDTAPSQSAAVFPTHPQEPRRYKW